MGQSEGAPGDTQRHTAYLGLGSSLGNRRAHLQDALHHLNQPDAGMRVAAVSSIYESPHLGLKLGDAERFPPHLNCVAKIETYLTPHEMLIRMQAAEAQGQRQRTQHWGPRTIDIDLLLYDELQMQSDELTIPHPGLTSRAFVLKPLFDLAPDLVLPNGQKLQELLESETIRAQPIERVTNDELLI